MIGLIPSLHTQTAWSLVLPVEFDCCRERLAMSSDEDEARLVMDLEADDGSGLWAEGGNRRRKRNAPISDSKSEGGTRGRKAQKEDTLAGEKTRENEAEDRVE